LCLPHQATFVKSIHSILNETLLETMVYNHVALSISGCNFLSAAAASSWFPNGSSAEEIRENKSNDVIGARQIVWVAYTSHTK
jgi:hypothetical protein